MMCSVSSLPRCHLEIIKKLDSPSVIILSCSPLTNELHLFRKFRR